MASPRIISDSVVVDTPPAVVFAILADPRAHLEIDGSKSVQGVASTQSGRKLALGDRFGMRMKIGLPYTVRNTVVEYDHNRLIAWQHFAKHTWRYELDEFEPGRTRVIESWDWSRSPYARLIELVGFPSRNRKGIAASLPKLKALAEQRAAGSPV
ncbi:MAG: SRPBCC family protein [Actinomycetota bacterium]|nr:SRPBCC family protein [Actinomycetota bacterium]